MHNHGKGFKIRFKIGLPEFFGLLFTGWAETFDFSQAE